MFFSIVEDKMSGYQSVIIAIRKPIDDNTKELINKKNMEQMFAPCSKKIKSQLLMFYTIGDHWKEFQTINSTNPNNNIYSFS